MPVVRDVVVDSAWQELGNLRPLVLNSRLHMNEQRIFSRHPARSLDVGVELIDPPLADLLVRAPGQVDSKLHPRHFNTVSTTLEHKIILLFCPRLLLFLGAIYFGLLGCRFLFAWVF